MATDREMYVTYDHCDIVAVTNLDGSISVREYCNEHGLPSCVFTAAKADVEAGLLQPGGIRRYRYMVIVQESEESPESVRDYWETRGRDYSSRR